MGKAIIQLPSKNQRGILSVADGEGDDWPPSAVFACGGRKSSFCFAFYLLVLLLEQQVFLVLGEPKIAAGAVMREAYNRRSGDNLTCLVVMFSWNLDRAEQILAGYAEAKKKRETLAQTSTALDMFA